MLVKFPQLWQQISVQQAAALPLNKRNEKELKKKRRREAPFSAFAVAFNRHWFICQLGSTAMSICSSSSTSSTSTSSSSSPSSSSWFLLLWLSSLPSELQRPPIEKTNRCHSCRNRTHRKQNFIAL